MNRKIATLAALVSLAAGSAFAETPNVFQDNFTSTASRAQVQAELAQFKRDGVNPWSTQYNPLRQFKSTATRADVTAAYIAARDEVAATTREDSGAEYFAQAGQRVPSATAVAGQPRNAQ